LNALPLVKFRGTQLRSYERCGMNEEGLVRILVFTIRSIPRIGGRG